MKLDISAAPEIALLAVGQDMAADRRAAGLSGPAALSGPAGPGRTAPATVGYLARCLRLLAAEPQSWWDLVWFDSLRPVHAPVPAPGPGCEAWLLVLPPTRRGDEQQPQWRWDVACLVAGAIAGPIGRRSRPLVSGRIRVRGSREPHHMTNAGRGYAVSLHARSVPARPPSQPPPGRARGQRVTQPSRQAGSQCDEVGPGLPAGSEVPEG
jgi:hypothetical protein